MEGPPLRTAPATHHRKPYATHLIRECMSTKPRTGANGGSGTVNTPSCAARASYFAATLLDSAAYFEFATFGIKQITSGKSCTNAARLITGVRYQGFRKLSLQAVIGNLKFVDCRRCSRQLGFQGNVLGFGARLYNTGPNAARTLKNMQW
jgi:hypothetical protein